MRKKGKLPARTIEQEYQLEYGSAVVEIHDDAIEAGQKVLIVDDLLATGGTAEAGIRLIERLGARSWAVPSSSTCPIWGARQARGDGRAGARDLCL